MAGPLVFSLREAIISRTLIFISNPRPNFLAIYTAFSSMLDTNIIIVLTYLRGGHKGLGG